MRCDDELVYAFDHDDDGYDDDEQNNSEIDNCIEI